MKKIIISLGLFLVLSGVMLAQSPFLTYKLANPMIKPGSPDTLVFDVLVKCDVTGTYHTDLAVYLNYNTAAFGASVVSNSAIVLERGDLIAEELFPGFFKYDFLGPADNTTSRVVFGTESALGYGNLSALTLVPDTYITYIKVKMAIASSSELAGITFQADLMNGNQYYEVVINTPLPYGTCVFENDFDDLPLDPYQGLLFSELGDAGSRATNFVEIYNAGTTTLDFDNDYAWYLNLDYASSYQLTGTLAPGAVVVVEDAGYNGGASYSLSIFGDYNDGIETDVYLGTTLNFTGMHAVRHYEITSPNTTFTESEWVLSNAAEADMTAGSHRVDLTWNGSTDGNWRDPSNWTAAYIPDAGHNAVIPNGGETTPVIGNGDNAYCHDLTINGSGVGLIIESDEVNGDGSLITFGTVGGTGMASVQRFLGADRYWYVTQPVTSALAGVFLHTWLFTYDESASDWTAFIEDETTPLNPGQGYAVWTSSVNSWSAYLPPVGDTTVAWEGMLFTGDQSLALTLDGDGWNFVGNLYPSSVDWEAGAWTKTDLNTDAYTVWTGTTNGTYTVGSGGTNGATQFIPPAQGFFVEAGSAGSLGMNNSVRAHSTQTFYKNQENMLNRLSLTISNGEVNDETVIYFNEDASAELDFSYDATKLMAVGAPQAYTMLNDRRMAINTFNSIDQTSSVNMGINAPEAGEYTITASNIESFDASTPIYLEDLLTGDYVNLRETYNYNFSAEEGMTERFIVHFANTQGIDDPASSEVTSVYSFNKEVYVDFNGSNGEIAIYNILGQEISRHVASNGLNILSVPQGNSVYIVKVISDNVSVTKKVFVK